MSNYENKENDAGGTIAIPHASNAVYVILSFSFFSAVALSFCIYQYAHYLSLSTNSSDVKYFYTLYYNLYKYWKSKTGHVRMLDNTALVGMLDNTGFVGMLDGSHWLDENREYLRLKF